MYSLVEARLKCNRNIKINFKGGEISSDSGLLLVKEFANKIGLEQIAKAIFKTKDASSCRIHKDGENLMQEIYKTIAGYFRDNDSDELIHEPVFKSILNKEALASQPTISRFYNRMDEATLKQFEEINCLMRRQMYSIKKPSMMLFDMDSTLLETYGKQEKTDFNFHYQSRGYHPLLCYDGLTRDLIKAELRSGSTYTSTGGVDFMEPLLSEYRDLYPETDLFFRGDSGFAVPDLYKSLESRSCFYAIRLKANNILRKQSAYLESELNEITAHNMVDYAVVYDDFDYQANSWDIPRRVAVKIEKPYGQFTYKYTFIVTNTTMTAKDVIKFYSNRGHMENFIKESKNGFDFRTMSSQSLETNANRLQVSMLAYNLFNWFRRIALPKNMRKHFVDTIRLKLLKIASRVVNSGRYTTFKLCSSCPYKKEFYETLENIHKITFGTEYVQLE